MIQYNQRIKGWNFSMVKSKGFFDNLMKNTVLKYTFWGVEIQKISACKGIAAKFDIGLDMYKDY